MLCSRYSVTFLIIIIIIIERTCSMDIDENRIDLSTPVLDSTITWVHDQQQQQQEHRLRPLHLQNVERHHYLPCFPFDEHENDTNASLLLANIPSM